MSNLIIYKHNELIENFIFNATETELQILNLAVAKTNPTWHQKNLVYRITVAEIASTYKTKSHNNYKLYSDALNRLMKRTYSFYRDNKETKVTENVIVRIAENEVEKWFEFRFNEYISERISKLKGLFTKYNIKNIAMFKSRYAFILYDSFCMRINQLPDGVHVYRQKISISDFKENLDLTGKYKRFDDLQKKVLNVAKSNISEHSNIRFSYEVIKTGRAPTHIKFTAQLKNPSKDPSIKNQTEIPDLDASRSSHNFTEPTGEQIAKRKADLKQILNTKWQTPHGQ